MALDQRLCNQITGLMKDPIFQNSGGSGIIKQNDLTAMI